MAETIFGKDFPFVEEGEIRECSLDRENSEYVWHRDNEDREIEVIEGQGWQFQWEDCLPYLLKKGMIFDIQKGEYHRLIKGKTKLICRVIKHG